MALSFGNSGSRDVQINVVPFIDLMSCLTAFLLVTAVWSAEGQILNEMPAGQGEPTAEATPLSVLVAEQNIWVGGEDRVVTQFARSDSGYDFEGLEQHLRDLIAQDGAVDISHVQIAGVDQVRYQTLITTLDIVREVGFRQVGILPPDELAVRFIE